MVAEPLVIAPWMWAAYVGLILGLLAIDVFVFHKGAHVVSIKQAALWSVAYIGLGLGFGGLVWAWFGPVRGGEYFAGYLIEKALSVDNIFVFAMVFAYFAVPAQYQHRVLFWGVVGAIVFRAIFIVAGAALLEEFHWLVYVFGAVLVVTGVKMALNKETEVHPDKNPLLRLARRFIPMTSAYHGQRFFVRHAGTFVATPLFAVLLVVEATDIVFAIDSIPVIFAVTREPFIVFASNAFAILGLRSLYFVLADMMHRFVYLKVGLGAILVFAGFKMFLSETPYKVDIWTSLGLIGLVLVLAIAASLIATRGGSERGDAARAITTRDGVAA
ncbi:MAG: TerC family protein [Chloroflexota bacterium]|nr:TerC family protein [Chloroflexota bacterium]